MVEILSERSLIADFLRPLSDIDVGRGLQDDSALLPLDEYIVSTDTLVENTHFLADVSASVVAVKLLVASLSDMAGSAAYPRYYLLNVTLTKAQDKAWISEFCEKLAELQKAYGIKLIGGDSTSGEQLNLTATLFGKPMRQPPPVRGDGKTGDIVYVTGTIGTAYLGLQSLRASPEFSKLNLPTETQQQCRQASLYPTARCQWSQAICEFLGKDLHALMDISDGLGIDAERLALASQRNLHIRMHDVPLLPAIAELTKHNKDLLARLISGGDDYELLFSVDEARAADFDKFCHQAKIQATAIGTIGDTITEPSQPVTYSLHDKPITLKYKGWEHFA